MSPAIPVGANLADYVSVTFHHTSMGYLGIIQGIYYPFPFPSSIVLGAYLLSIASGFYY